MQANRIINKADITQRIEKSKKLHVAMVTFAELGHFIPMVRLADALVQAGHKVTLMTNNYFREKAQSLVAKAELKCQLLFPDE